MHDGEEFGLPPAGHNSAGIVPLIDPERLAAMEAAVRDWSDAAGEWLDRGPLATEEDAGKVADLMTGARKLAKRIDDARVDIKGPHLAAGRAIDEAFKKLLAPLELVQRRVGDLQTAYLKAKRAADEARKAADERAAAEADRQAKADLAAAQARHDVVGEAEAEAAVAAAQEAAAEAARPVKANVQSASGGGRTVALRTTRRGRITNLSMAFGAVRHDPAVVEAIEAAVNRIIRSKDFDPNTTIPGVEIVIEERAA